MSHQNKALLFCLDAGIGKQSEKDKQTTAEVTASKHAEKDVLTCTLRFFPPGTLKPINFIKARWRRRIVDLTHDWKGGLRICSTRAMSHVQQICAEEAPQFVAAKRALIDIVHPQLLAGLQQRIGQLNMTKFPSAADLEESIHASWDFLPLPDGADMGLLEGLSPEDKRLAELNAQRELAERFQAGQNATWKAALEPVRLFIERLSQPEETISKASVKFIRELMERTALVNFGDEELDAFCAGIKTQLATWDVEILRKDDLARREVAVAGQTFLDQFKHVTAGLGQRRFSLMHAAAEGKAEGERLKAEVPTGVRPSPGASETAQVEQNGETFEQAQARRESMENLHGETFEESEARESIAHLQPAATELVAA